MDVQPANLESPAAARLQQRMRDDAREPESYKEPERAEKPRLLVKLRDLSSVRGADPSRAISEPSSGVRASGRAVSPRGYLLRSNGSPTYEPHDRD
jgi:hypothetical protein